MSPPLFELRDLRVRFPYGRRSWLGRARAELDAVAGVSLVLERGESLGLVGESGSGKSTLARAVVGLARKASGQVLLDGVDLDSLRGRARREARRRVQMLHQDPFASLDPRRTALESVVEPLAIHGLLRPRERKLRALVLLEAVGLDPKSAGRFPHEFSGGQRQRIALARALALEPDVLLLDEPTSALDVSVQAQVVLLLGELQRRFGIAYLFISHDLALVRHLCPRVAVLYAGRVVESAPRELLFRAPRHPYTQMLLACAPLADPELERQRAPALDASAPQSPPATAAVEDARSAAPARGCPFHPRCPERARVPGDRCRVEEPPLEARGERSSACFLP